MYPEGLGEGHLKFVADRGIKLAVPLIPDHGILNSIIMNYLCFHISSQSLTLPEIFCITSWLINLALIHRRVYMHM